MKFNFMTKSIVFYFVFSFLYGETITIDATESALFRASGCCNMDYFTEYNSNYYNTHGCQDTYFGCGLVQTSALWRFDLSAISGVITSARLDAYAMYFNQPEMMSISGERGQFNVSMCSL